MKDRNDSLIEEMLSATLEDNKKSSSPQKFYSFLDREKISFVPVKYEANLKIFRFFLENQCLDCPQDWSLFKVFYEELVQKERPGWVLLGQQEDQEKLLVILKNFHMGLENIILGYSGGEIALCFLGKETLSATIEAFVDYFNN